jgi:hypothetical protein
MGRPQHAGVVSLLSRWILYLESPTCWVLSENVSAGRLGSDPVTTELPSPGGMAGLMTVGVMNAAAASVR